MDDHSFRLGDHERYVALSPQMKKETDWRLQGQDRYLKGAVVTYRKYRCHSKSCDHDHCEFCGAKFMEESSDPEVQTEGYTTVDEYRWICPTCLADFKERYAIAIRDTTDDRT